MSNAVNTTEIKELSSQALLTALTLPESPVYPEKNHATLPDSSKIIPGATKTIDLLSADTYARKVSALRKDPDISLAQQLLGDDYETILSPGIRRYKDSYEAKVRAFKAGLSDKERAQSNFKVDANNRTFFREAFQQLLNDILSGKRPAPKNDGDPNQAVSLETLLGKDGMALCLLATEEEVHCLDYRMAVTEQSVSGYSGNKWTQLPSITLAGPSGSGKSVVINSLIPRLTQSVPVKDNSATNLLIKVDGEQSRAEDEGNPTGCSMALTSAIIVAKHQGFQGGISDLYDKTKPLTESAKQVVREVAFVATERGSAGHIMPETFTDYFASRHIRESVRRLVGLGRNANVQSIFVDIRANANAVRHQAEERAKKQSKAYNTYGFRFSEFCTSIVKKIFMAGTGAVTYVNYTNDRILVKPAKVAGQDTWVEASYGDEGAIPVSQRTFAAWLAAKKKGTTQEDLPKYADDQQPKALLHFENGIGRAHHRIKLCMAELKQQKLQLNSKLEPEAFVRISAKINYMKRILRHSPMGLSATAAEKAIATIIAEGNSITIKGHIVHPQNLFSAKEREAISSVIDCLEVQSKTRVQQTSLSGANESVSVNAAQVSTASLTASSPDKQETEHTEPKLSLSGSNFFANKTPQNRIDKIYAARAQLVAYIEKRKNENKKPVLGMLYNLSRHTADEKIYVANLLISHLTNILNSGSSSIQLTLKQEAVAKQGRIGDIFNSLIKNRLIKEIPLRAATTDDMTPPKVSESTFATKPHKPLRRMLSSSELEPRVASVDVKPIAIMGHRF